jgi:hypothetical protein
MMSRIDSRHWKISSDHNFQNGHHNAAQIQHCLISTTFHMWVDYVGYRTMLNFCGIVAAILKMAIVRNFSMSGINSGPHYLPTYQTKWLPQYRTNSTLSDFNDILYVDRLWCPKFIPDIEKFLASAIFKMDAKIQHCPISNLICG